ncbi:MAG: hypothetical protein AAF191_19055, partial [Verrucomicrobiota bacterium]
ELKSRIYWRSYPQDDYPSSWNFGSGGPQFGDRFLVLKSGYAFSDQKGSEPVFNPSETGGPFATCGFSVANQSRMYGQAFFSQLDGGYGSDLGEIEGRQLHATVCSLLGIEPAAGVEAKPISLE